MLRNVGRVPILHLSAARRGRLVPNLKPKMSNNTEPRPVATVDLSERRMFGMALAELRAYVLERVGTDPHQLTAEQLVVSLLSDAQECGGEQQRRLINCAKWVVSEYCTTAAAALAGRRRVVTLTDEPVLYRDADGQAYWPNGDRVTIEDVARAAAGHRPVHPLVRVMHRFSLTASRTQVAAPAKDGGA